MIFSAANKLRITGKAWLILFSYAPQVASAGDQVLSSQAANQTATADEARAAIARGVAFLLKDQNPEGSWGGPRNAVYTFTGDVWSNPETHRSWKVATTGLACMALLECDSSPAAQSAIERGIEYILKNGNVHQPNEWDTMNSWAYIYGVQALAAVYAHPRYAQSPLRDRIPGEADQMLKLMGRFQSLSGGWGYLELDPPRTARPQWATSFTTAAGVVAMQEARSAGLRVDDGMLQRAVRAVQRCRLANGAYAYSVPVIPDPSRLEWIDQVQGSLGRIQVCHVALTLTTESIPADALARGMRQLFQYHKFLDIARNKPIPHETFYFNSGYFYLFGHYYAARVVESLPQEQQAEFWPRLRHEVIKVQQADGSMWDYDMHAYHKPYGTSFGIMALQRSLK